MKNLPDHVNRHRTFRSDELPRRYRRMRFEETNAMVLEREIDSEILFEMEDDYWDPWIGRRTGAYGDFISSHELLHRAAWTLVFEKGPSIAAAVPPEEWARLEKLVVERKSPDSPDPSSVQPRKRNPETLAARLKERLRFICAESPENCERLLRSEMRQVPTGQLGDLISLCEGWNPSEMNALQEAVTTLMLLQPFWLRDLSSWEMPNQNAVEAFDSLLAHLFVEFPVPSFLYEAWTVPGDRGLRPAKWIAWFVLLGQGASLHRASDLFGWRVPEGLAARLLGAPQRLTPFEACAWAEVHRLGGSAVEFERIREHPAFAIDFTEPFGEWDAEFGEIPDWFVHGRAFTARFLKFWRETIPWLVRYRDQLYAADCPIILAWAAERARLAPETAPFSWRGRTPRSCLRHAAIAAGNFQYPHRNLRWKSKGWNWDWRPTPEEHWSIRELTTEKALHGEGARMEHCVALYTDRCFSGQSSIFSLEHLGEPCLTIEVSPLHREIAQVRGHRNRSATDEENAVIECWNTEVLLVRKTPEG